MFPANHMHVAPHPVMTRMLINSPFAGLSHAWLLDDGIVCSSQQQAWLKRHFFVHCSRNEQGASAGTFINAWKDDGGASKSLQRKNQQPKAAVAQQAN